MSQREQFVAVVTTATVDDDLRVYCFTTEKIVTVSRSQCTMGSGFPPGNDYLVKEESIGNKRKVLYTLTGAYQVEVNSGTCVNGKVHFLVSNL